MIDIITSKFALLVASVLVLTSALGLVSLQRDALEAQELENIVERISRTVDDMASAGANSRVSICFAQSNNATYAVTLPLEVGGKEYSIEITKGFALVSQGSRAFSRKFSMEIHPWNPGAMANADRAYLDFQDDSSERLSIAPSKSILDIESRTILVDGSYENEVFVHEG